MKISDFTAVEHPYVAILMGSDSDLETMAKAHAILSDFAVPAEIKVMSAHRNPDDLEKYVAEAPRRGVKVFICGAGMAAHLGGVVAAKTTLPVIGVPCLSKSTGGLDSLLSMVQMPKGVPVATVAIDGAMNAGILAVQILALGDAELAKKLVNYKSQMAEEGRGKNE
ncbi:MAG: 5-(carboxyamino)imidazole ribonucleotide mutase [bacterium]|nr:5-(carboxyamino)imidazole ribonucleotide mutase [bacterium]